MTLDYELLRVVHLDSIEELLLEVLVMLSVRVDGFELAGVDSNNSAVEHILDSKRRYCNEHDAGNAACDARMN